MAKAPARILVADDLADVLVALRMLLTDADYQVATATSPAEALAQLRHESCDLLLVDLNYARDTTSGDEGLALIGEIRRLDETVPIVVMTAFGSIELAVRAMREGAQDFVEKPWDNYRLLAIVKAQLELASARRRLRQLEVEAPAGLIAESPAMRRLLAMAERVADADVAVLITGENGVGKGEIARFLHARSRRAAAPLATIDMGTLSAGLVESELFGHEAGAFTDAKTRRAGRFELADGGTLFLDEVGNFPVDQQQKLLRVLERGEFERVGSSTLRRTDVRLICATNAELAALVEQGRFRRDLYYRLNTVELHVPPLRERPEDIPALAAFFLAACGRKYRREPRGFSPGASQALLGYGWPGNVRELAHTVERAIVLGQGEQVEAGDLHLPTRVEAGSRRRAPAPTVGDEGIDFYALTLDDAEKRLICNALARHDGHITDAAQALGLSRSALYRRLERFGLSVPAAVEAGSG